MTKLGRPFYIVKTSITEMKKNNNGDTFCHKEFCETARIFLLRGEQSPGRKGQHNNAKYVRHMFEIQIVLPDAGVPFFRGAFGFRR